MTSSSFFDIQPLECGCGETCRRAMDACSLCGIRLAGDRDIFMYRGDTPFCSEECRYQQMLSDDADARRTNSREHRPAMKEQHQRHSSRHEPARVQIAANVPVAT